MKKALFLVLVTLLMAGCSGGGDSPANVTSGATVTPGGDVGGGGTPTGPVGYITVVLPEGVKGPTTMVPVRSDFTTFVGLRNWFRVVAKRMVLVDTTDEEGNPITVNVEASRVVKDSPVTDPLTIAVPAGTGYVVELLTYTLPTGGTIRSMLEYGKTATFDVVPGTNNPQNLTLAAVSTFISMTVQDNVTKAAVTNLTAGFPYNVNVVKTIPLRLQYYLTATDLTALWGPAIADFVVGYGATGALQRTTSNVSFTAPAVTVPGNNLYVQGQFFIDDSLLSAQERATNPSVWPNWRINCPDPEYNVQVGVPLLEPGNVPIIVN